MEFNKKELDILEQALDIYIYHTDKYDDPFIEDKNELEIAKELYEKINGELKDE